jgi:uncharacterized coiled-coil DUF342 family protein
MSDTKEDYDLLREERDMLHGSIHEFVARVKELKQENEELKKSQCECTAQKPSDGESETP